MKKINSSLTKQYSLLTLSNLGTMAIAFVTNIIMTTLLSESEYGSYRYIVNVITMLVSFLNFGLYYSSARLLTKANHDKERKIYAATIQLLLCIIIVSSLVIYLTYQIISTLEPSLDSTFLYAIPLMYTIMFQRTFIYMLKGSNRITDVALQTILPHIIILLIYIFVYLIDKVKVDFILSLIIYGAAYLITNIITINRLKIPILRETSNEISELFAEQKVTGIEIYKGSLLGVFAGDLLNVLIGSIAMKAEYATYTLALSLSAPLLQIPATMGVVQFKNNANLSKIKTKEVKYTILLTMTAYISMNVFLQFFFPLLYKGSYSGTLEYIIFVSLGYMFHGLGDYFNNFLNSQGKGRLIKYGAYATGIAQVLLAFIFIPKFEIWGLVISRVGSSFLYLIIMVFAYYSEINKSLRSGESD